MYLFKDKEEIEIPITCKVCLEEFKFKVTAEEYKGIETFPIKKSMIHGEPKHNLTVYIDRNLEIENFKIDDVIEKEDISYSEELTKQVLSDIELTDDEIEIYFRTTGRGEVSLGEMALLSNKTKEECKIIADRFVEKGLFKKIIGAKGRDHFQALPPYSALVKQLQTFHSYIADIKSEAPAQLSESFNQLESQTEGIKQLKDYTDFILDLKENTLSQLFNQKQDFDQIATAISQIGEISNVITALEGNTKDIMDSQIDDLTNQFKDISTKISNSMQKQIEDLTKQYEGISTEISNIIKNQVSQLPAQLEGIKAKISKNLEKLRLGVLQQAVDRVVEMSFTDWIKNITESLNQQLSTIDRVSKDGVVKTKIGLNRQISEIQNLHNDGLEKTTEMFHTQFISKLKDAIGKTVKNIDGITSSTAKSGEDVKAIFENISEKFGQAVSMAEEKLGGISENVFNSFEDLKEIFSKKVIQTLNDVLEDIINHVDRSEKVTNEFWEKAKGGASFTMKDIWFIRSLEGAKAHINDEISKAKMRILIVAPEITDVNLDNIKATPTHVNIRIAAYIDLSNPEHRDVLEELDKMQNVTCRNRKLQNLFGINKDYEEVVVCVLSKTQIGDDLITEIAGIGSIIQEHIKIFVPILEDAWMGAQKDVALGLRMSNLKPQEPRIPEPVKEPIPEPSIPEPVKEPIPEPSIPEPVKESISEPVKEPIQESPISTTVNRNLSAKDSLIANQFDSLINNLNNLTGTEISSILNNVRDDITESRGYTGVLRPISLTISSLRFNSTILSKIEIDQIKNKIEFWREKLNL